MRSWTLQPVRFSHSRFISIVSCRSVNSVTTGLTLRCHIRHGAIPFECVDHQTQGALADALHSSGDVAGDCSARGLDLPGPVAERTEVVDAGGVLADEEQVGLIDLPVCQALSGKLSPSNVGALTPFLGQVMLYKVRS